jgi:peptide/nickel transport system permease protein
VAIGEKRGAATGAGPNAAGSGALAEISAETAVEGAGIGVESSAPAKSQWQLVRRRFFRHKLAVLAALVLLVLYGSALFASQVAPYELNPELNAETLAESRQPPSAKHWFGTDELGRDQLTRVLHAGRVSLLVGLAVALASTAIGTTIGSFAGYYGGWIDQLLMRVTDLFLIVPQLAVLMIAQKGLLGRELLGIRMTSTTLIIVILSFLFWQYVARVVRGLFLSIKEKEYVEAARASGATSTRIIFRHIVPNCIGPIAVNTTLAVGTAILIESVLSFLGFGIQPPAVSWGNMVAQSQGAVGTPQAYLIYFPGLAILVTVLAINFLGDGLRDAFDPQSSR